MKISFVLLCIFAMFGFLCSINLLHESYHYFDLKRQPNVIITDFCAVAVPIPENDYGEAGFVNYNYTNVKQIPESSELVANTIMTLYGIIGIITFLYLYQKEN